jgi:polysaccharide biosynthesis protein PslH
MTGAKARLLVISGVKPFPRQSGQQQRVYNKLKALQPFFEITFLTFARSNEIEKTRQNLLSLVDHAVVIPSSVQLNFYARMRTKVASYLYVLRTGLKSSNYLLGQLELSPARIKASCQPQNFDLVVYEYWHTFTSTEYFRNQGVPCVLDMHDILWHSYQKQLETTPFLPSWWKRWALKQYRSHEEQAWRVYDALIAINVAESAYASRILEGNVPIFNAPMGADLDEWPYVWAPANPPRIAYYGGLGNPNNQKEAIRCYERIMPTIWQERPDTEFWLIGSNPSKTLIQLQQQDVRVKVTGYVERVQDVLKTMTMVLCPFSATFGFRSRLIEAMALGIPIVATPDAVYGMEITSGQGVFLHDSDKAMALACLDLLRESNFAEQQSKAARAQVEARFSFGTTYGQLAKDLLIFSRKPKRQTIQ